MEESMRLSYTYTPTLTSYMYETVTDRLQKLASADPDRDAFVFYGLDGKRSSLTRKQFLDKSTDAAKSFVQSGVKKGSPVALCMANSFEMLIANMGVIMAGGVPFYLSPNLKDGSDLVDFMNNLEAEILILDANVGDENWKILKTIWPSEEKFSSKIPSLKLVICNGGEFEETKMRKKLATVLEVKPDETITLPALQPEDTLAYFCTSGSTGKPKEVIYTHFCILNFTKFSNSPLGIKEKSIFFCDRTFSWVVGFPRTYLTEGATRIFIDTKMSISGRHTESICDIIEKERCDVVYLPGYLVTDLLSNVQLLKRFKNVDTIFFSGERAQKTNIDSLKRYFDGRVVIYYGSTEGGGLSTYIPASDQGFEDGIVGKPLQGVEMKIIDDSGEVVPVGVKGELCARCSWRFAGYRGMEELFRETVDVRGWLHTGDIAHLREDGNIVIDGRKKEMISTGTNKYFPWTIERALNKMEGIENAFVVGVPDRRLNQVVCACVLPKQDVSLTEDDVKKFCDETFLEESTSMGVSLKPRYCIIINKIPLTSSGKIDRRTITFQARKRLGL